MNMDEMIAQEKANCLTLDSCASCVIGIHFSKVVQQAAVIEPSTYSDAHKFPVLNDHLSFPALSFSFVQFRKKFRN